MRHSRSTHHNLTSPLREYESPPPHNDVHCFDLHLAPRFSHDNLLAIQPKRFGVTTNSNHRLEVYLNVASRMKLTGISQRWVAEITTFAWKARFVCLGVILYGFSRKVVGWAVDRTMMIARLTVTALERAVADRQPPAGLVRHSDRAIQYASPEYVAALDKYGMVASMGRRANPFDNASCESFMKTLKREEIYANWYHDIEGLRANVKEFIEQYYNQQRLHSALGYQSPIEFEERNARVAADPPSATIVFFETM
jgi:putative transposase